MLGGKLGLFKTGQCRLALSFRCVDCSPHETHGTATKRLERAQRGVDEGSIADDDEVLKDLGCFGRYKGAGTVSTAAAVYLCARYAAQPVQAVLKAAFSRSADTDTIAAMSGGLMGCLAGRDWLPREWTNLQDHGYLSRISNEVARGPTANQRPLVGLRQIGQKELDGLRSALIAGQQRELDLDGVRRARVMDCLNPKPLSTLTFVKIWQLRTSDGQVIYITKLGRKSKDEVLPEPASPPSVVPRNFKQGAFDANAAGLKLTVADMKSMASFYEGVLGLRPGKQSRRFVSYGALSLIDGRTAHELSGGAVDLATPAHRHQIQVYVKDLEAVFRRIKLSAAKVLQPITEMPWKERVFRCADPEGNLVEVAEGL